MDTKKFDQIAREETVRLLNRWSELDPDRCFRNEVGFSLRLNGQEWLIRPEKILHPREWHGLDFAVIAGAIREAFWQEEVPETSEQSGFGYRTTVKDGKPTPWLPHVHLALLHGRVNWLEDQ